MLLNTFSWTLLSEVSRSSHEKLPICVVPLLGRTNSLSGWNCGNKAFRYRSREHILKFPELSILCISLTTPFKLFSLVRFSLHNMSASPAPFELGILLYLGISPASLLQVPTIMTVGISEHSPIDLPVSDDWLLGGSFAYFNKSPS